MEEEEFPRLSVTVAGTQASARAVVSSLACIIVRGPLGPEPHIGPFESPVLLVWYGRRCQRLAETCITCMKRKSPTGRHYPLGNIPTGHRWYRIAMEILDVCDPTSDGYHYILVIADYFSKWTEAFPIKNKCADTVADVLVDKIILLLECSWLSTAIRGGNLRMD